MDFNTDKIYLKSKNSFLLTTILLTMLFLVGMFLQNIFPEFYFQVQISILLVVVSFVFNILLGMTGFVISLALNILQIITYSYRFFVFGSTTSYYLLEVTGISIVLILFFQLFMKKVSLNITSLREKLDYEQSRRIASETTSLIESSMLRPNLIVKHDSIKDANVVTEAIGNSRSHHLDSLTTLPGREKIFEHIDNLVDESIVSNHKNTIRIIYMTALDSENFLNNLGHRATDLFIQCIAHRIRECASPEDLVGRISRLEFVIVTNRNMNEEELHSYIDSLIMAAEDSVIDETGKSHLKYYAGYSVFPETSRFSGDLLHEAEHAVREAIKTNTNPLHYNSEGNNHLYSDSPLSGLNDDEIANTIDNAIKGDEIYMVYQPQFDKDMNLVGFEAFVRWDSPVYGHITPSNFLLAAEHVNKMYEIGTVGIRKALATLSEINKVNPKLKMAINLSSIQLKNPAVVQDFSDLTSVYNINRENVVIDIPEESLLTNINDSRPVIDAFAELGITMALDNFGRCYSSLNNIPLFPISLVKLDGHFTADLKAGSHMRILSSSIIDLLNEIDIPVNATGVSSKDQFEALSSFGCRYFQGRFLCEPMNEDSALEFVKSKS